MERPWIGENVEASRIRIRAWFAVLALAAGCTGCGTTKWTDTARTASEQLLVADCVDRAVSRLDLRALAAKKVFVDETPIKAVTDEAYLLSAIRQQLLAGGAILKSKQDEADYIVEIRAGAVGTDRHDVLFGIPPTQLPAMAALGGVPSQIPEIAFAKSTDQRGIANVSLFAYNRRTGRPLWQSGVIQEQSRLKAVWVLGIGPIRRGTIDKQTTFAGDHVHLPLIDPSRTGDSSRGPVAAADEAFFVEPKEQPPGDVKPATAEAPKAPEKGPAAAPPAAGAPPATSPAASPATPAGQSPSTVAVPRVTRTNGTSFWSKVENDVAGMENALSVPATPAASSPPPPAASSPGDALFGDSWLKRRR